MKSPRIENNMVAAFYAGGDEAGLHMEILDRIAHIADDEERASRLAMLGLVMSYRGKAPSPEVMDRMKEIAMGSQMWLEGNPILEPSFNKGKAEGEARGILIGKAMSHDAPEPVIEAIRQCPVENLAAMGKRVDEATRTSDWSEIAAIGPSVR